MKFFDLHCDTVTACMSRGEELFENSMHLSLKRGAAFERWFEVFAVFVPDTMQENEALEYFESACSFFEAQLDKNRARARPVLGSRDMSALPAGCCGAILAMENSKAVTDTATLERLYQRGLRLLTLTWNGANAAGGGCGSGGGLTAWGCELVKNAESLGIVVDASHLSDAAFWDLARTAQRPFIASHSNARGAFSHRRCLSDGQIELIVGRRGLIGLNFCKDFLAGDAGYASLLAQAEYMLSLGARDALCIGSDFDGCETGAGVTGIEAVARIRAYFEENGFSCELCDKIFYENARTFFENVLQ